MVRNVLEQNDPPRRIHPPPRNCLEPVLMLQAIGPTTGMLVFEILWLDVLSPPAWALYRFGGLECWSFWWVGEPTTGLMAFQSVGWMY